MAQSNQDDLLDFVNDPETIKRAAEGSMEKRSRVMAQSNGDELRHSVHMKMLSSANNAKEVGHSTVVLLGFAVDVAMELIKQHELDARIDEAARVRDFNQASNDHPDIYHFVNDRIGELKREREAR